MIEDYVEITVTDNINVINIIPSITDEIIDINVADNRDDVTINVTDSIIEVNINKVTGILNNIWGNIGGTLSNQTDLQNALNGKAATLSGTSGYISKFTSGSTIGNSIIFDNGVNVGIGTITPQRQLDILAVPYAANQLGGLRLSNSNNTTFSIELLYGISSIGASYASLRAPYDGNGWLDFWTNGSEKMRLTAGGSLGIGTTSPTSKLHVNGLVDYATNALAIAGGLTVGAFYHTSGVLKVVI